MFPQCFRQMGSGADVNTHTHTTWCTIEQPKCGQVGFETCFDLIWVFSYMCSHGNIYPNHFNITKIISGQISGVGEQDLQSAEPLPFHFNLLLLLTVTCSCYLSLIVSLWLSPLPHFISYHLLSFFNQKLYPTKLPSKTRLHLWLHIFHFSSSLRLTPFKLYFWLNAIF